MSRLAAILALALTLISCGPETDAGGGAAISGPLTVLAASSLTEVFAALEPLFEASHDGIDVQLQHGASTGIARQVADGAAADVLATADRPSLDDAQEHLDRPTLFARSRLEIIVERSNPRGIRSLADLGDSSVTTVLCAPEVPCGRLAAAALRRADVDVKAASFEQNVKAVVGKVTLGEADAGIVYAPDVLAAGEEAEGVAIDGSDAPALQAEYFVASVADSRRPEAARRWIKFLTSSTAQRILRDAGFELP